MQTRESKLTFYSLCYTKIKTYLLWRLTSTPSPVGRS